MNFFDKRSFKSKMKFTQLFIYIYIYIYIEGTPSLAEPETISSVLNCISKHAELQHHCEITLEVNPTEIEIGKLW